MKHRHGNGQKALSHGTRSASKYTVTNRFETFRCQARPNSDPTKGAGD
jgi:hypothetical protein